MNGRPVLEERAEGHALHSEVEECQLDCPASCLANKVTLHLSSDSLSFPDHYRMFMAIGSRPTFSFSVGVFIAQMGP